jgi:signal transduction histidine kinase
VELLRSNRQADSVLNHVLKNSIAGAACLIELDQADPVSTSTLSGTTCSCGRRDRLKQALEQLYKSMKWCSSRQAILDITSGNYQTTLSPVNITSLLESFYNGTARFKSQDDTSSLTSSGESTIAFDEKIASLALENAVSNAIAHGDGALIQLSAAFRTGGGNKACMLGDHCCLCVTSHNLFHRLVMD